MTVTTTTTRDEFIARYRRRMKQAEIRAMCSKNKKQQRDAEREAIACRSIINVLDGIHRGEDRIELR